MAILLQVLVTLPHQSQMIIVGSWWSWSLTDCIMKLLMKSFAVRGIVVVTYVYCTMVQLGWKYTRIFKELSVLLVPYECMPSPCTFSTLFLCLIESVTVQQKMWASPFDIWVFLQKWTQRIILPFPEGTGGKVAEAAFMWVLEFKSLRWLLGVIEENFSCLYFYEFGKSSSNKFLRALWRAVGIACNDHWRCCEKNMNEDQSRLQSHLLFGQMPHRPLSHHHQKTRQMAHMQTLESLHCKLWWKSLEIPMWIKCKKWVYDFTLSTVHHVSGWEGNQIRNWELSYCCFIAMRVLIPSYRKEEGDGCGGIIF